MLTLSPSSLIMTTHGLRRAAQLVRKPFWTYLDGLAHCCPEGMQELGERPVAQVQTRQGYRVRLAPQASLLTPSGPVPVASLAKGQSVCLNRHYPYGMWIGRGSFAEGHEAGHEQAQDQPCHPPPELAGLSSQYGRGYLQALFSRRATLASQGRLQLPWHPAGLEWVQALLIQYGLPSSRQPDPPGSLHPDLLTLEWSSTVNFAHYIYGISSSQIEQDWPQDSQPYPTATFECLRELEPAPLLGCRVEGKNRLAVEGLLLGF